MLLEIRNTPITNQGAQLMLRAIVQQLGSAHTFCASYRNATDETCRELGFRALAWVQFFGQGADLAGNVKGAFTRLAPGSNVCTPSQIDGVLDASGFAYGDQWGATKSRISASYYRRLKQRGGKVILLPQALGPFEDPGVADAFAGIVESADVVFARDTTSFDAAVKVCGALDKIRCAPDFSVLIEGRAASYEPVVDGAAIVPNAKMIQMDAANRRAYLELLRHVATSVQAAGLTPFALVHERDDVGLAKELQETHPMRIIEESNPLTVKWLLSQARFVMSSRFHGLVNSLSSGVPSIATGWSHKYDHLLADYGCPECLLSPDAEATEVEALITRILTQEYDARVATLRAAAERQRQLSVAMWTQVEALLG